VSHLDLDLDICDFDDLELNVDIYHSIHDGVHQQHSDYE